MMNDFWTRQSDWPRETRTHVFLAEAVIRAGKAIYNNVWLGDEPGIELQEELPSLFRSDRHERVRAHATLTALKKTYRPKSNFLEIPPSLSRAEPAVSLPDYEFDDADWDAASKAIKEKNLALAGGALRFAEAKNQILKAATLGNIETFVRPKNSIDMFALPADIWALVKPHNIFSCCEINPKEPAGLGVTGDRFMPIFVSRLSLDQWLTKIISATEPQSEAVNTPVKRKSGRKPKWDWPEAEAFIIRELNEKGDPDEVDQMKSWSCQADVEKAIFDHLNTEDGGPAESLAREKAKEFVERWRKGR